MDTLALAALFSTLIGATLMMARTDDAPQDVIVDDDGDVY